MQERKISYFVKKHPRLCKVLLLIIYFAVILLPFAIALLSGARSDLLREIGKSVALVGFAILCMQAVLVSRFRFLDAVFGIDAAAQFHKVTAVCAAILLIAHPLLLAVASGHFGLLASGTSWQVNIGKIALLFLILTAAFAMTFDLIGVDYNIWRFLHKSAILIVLLGFTHSLLIGSDLNSAVMRVCWLLLLAAAVCVYIWRNAFVPFWGRRRFKVTTIEPETHDTYTVTFEPDDHKPFPRHPGQFMFLKLTRPGRRSEIHPFTISASPSKENIVQATIKKSGNFTDTIDQIVPGDRGFIEGPFGKFSLVHHDAEKLLFIAGGVGITPLMSMLRYLKETKDFRPVVLLYGNKTESDIIFRHELEGLSPNVTVVHILSRPDDFWKGPRGHIDRDVIQRYAAEFLPHAHIFLCGPPLMMTSVRNCLKQLGIPAARIHSERFTL